MIRQFLAAIAFSTLSLVHGQNCNICGDGNSIQNRLGVVEFVYQNTTYKNNCETWQVVVQNPNAISDDFCRNEMLQYTKDTCRCTTPEGDLLSDIASPTMAPTPTSVSVKTPSATTDNDADHNEPSTVSKCEQTSGSENKDCNDADDAQETSSATKSFFICVTYALIACVGAYSSL